MKPQKPNPNDFTALQSIIAAFLIIETLTAIITQSSIHTFYAIAFGVALAITIYRRML